MALVLAFAPAAPAQPPAGVQALALRATLSHTGYVGVVLSGPPASQVRLGEVLGSATRPIATVDLGTTGTAGFPHALIWRCDRRERTLTATTVAPAAPQSATISVKTPLCDHRLGASFSSRAQVNGNLAIYLRDKWRLGSLLASICVTPPGARVRCSRWWIRTGERIVKLAIPRPGGWRVRVGLAGGYGRPSDRMVWASHPGGRIRLLAAGDSEMQILDDFLAQDLGRHGVSVTQDARISTGLTKPFFFDWQAEARRQAASLSPDVTVMFIGANDGFAAGGVPCCGPGWAGGYANLVAQMMRTYLHGGAGRVYWFTLPAPVPGSFSSLFGGVNAGIRSAARRFAGRVSLVDADAFFTPGGYRDFMTYRGQGFVIHEADGVHLSTAADAVAAQLVMKQMLADRVIR